MALAIKATSTNTNSCPTHAAGDLLLGVHWGISLPTYNPGWTVQSEFGTVWYYDNFSVVYRVATDSSTAAPWSTYSGGNGYGTGSRVYAIGGADKKTPISNSVVSPSTTSSTTIASVPTPGSDPGASSSVYIPSSGSRISIPNVAALQMGTGDFTYEYWIKPTTYNPNGNGYGTHIARGSIVGELAIAWMGSQDGIIRVLQNYGVILTASQAISLNVWTHVALVRSGTTLTLYQNGVSVGSVTDTANYAAGAATVIGGEGNDWTMTGTTFSGIRIVKGTAVYTSNFTPPTSQLSAISGTSFLLGIDSTSGAIKDTSSNNLTITSVGAAELSYINPFKAASMGNNLRFTMLQSIGGGGNPDLNVKSVNGLLVDNLVFDTYFGIWLGGIGALTVGGGGWYKRYTSFTITPGVESGFFSMF